MTRKESGTAGEAGKRWERRPFVPALMAGILALQGCMTAAESSASVEVADSAGVRIVENFRPRWTEGEEWIVPTEPDLTVGVLSGPDEYQLQEVVSAARMAGGHLVVVDGGAKAVRLYDSEGRFVRTMGGPGAGPGEFQAPGEVHSTAGDTVVVWDKALFRITRFAPGGELVEVETVDMGAMAKAVQPPLYPGTVVPLQDGDLLVRLVEKAKANPTGLFRPASGALRMAGDLSSIDTLMFFGDQEQFTVDAPFGRWPMAPPLAKDTWLTHQGAPPRICIGEQEGPEIRCFGPDGGLTIIRWTQEEGRAPTREELAAWRRGILDEWTPKLREDQVLALLDQVPVPETRPAYTRIILDHVGNLWMGRGPAEGDPKGGLDFLVFDREGALLGTVAVPPLEVLEIGSDYLLGVSRDEYDVEYLQLHEVRKPGG